VGEIHVWLNVKIAAAITKCSKFNLKKWSNNNHNFYSKDSGIVDARPTPL